MKKVIAFMAFLAFAVMGYAQAPRHLQGPRAKNYKPYLKSSPQVGSIAHIQVNPRKPKGPKAKHAKAWRADASTKYVPTGVKTYSRLIGPRYKNLRAWQEAPKPKVLIVEEKLPRKKQKQKNKSTVAP